VSTAQLLVIDDSATIRKLVQIAFRESDFAVDFAGSGRDGIELAQRRAPDVILLDFMLPDMKGIDVCRRLAATPETARIGVVVMSGKSDIASLFRDSPNVVAFLPKPFTPAAVSEQVRAALRRGDRSGMRSAPIPVLVDDAAKSPRPHRLVLEGELEMCSSFDLLRLLLSSNHTGTLIVADYRVYLRAGSIIMCTVVGGDVEPPRTHVPEDVLARARDTQHATGKPACVTLAEQGYGLESDLVPTLKQWSQQTLAAALAARVGHFAWEAQALPGYVDMLGRPIPFRAAALDHAHTHAPPPAALEQIYQRTLRFSEAIAGLRLSPAERLVLASVDGIAPLHELCERTKLPARTLLQTVGQLAAVDLLVRVESSAQPGDTAPLLAIGLDAGFVAQLRHLLARRPVPVEVVDVGTSGPLEETVARVNPRLILVAVHGTGIPKELHALARLRSATIIAVLELGANDTTAATLSLGFDAALYKPVHIAEIERLLST
jgi:DNA-binding response OmpR family regulator